jgi:hypothetical protein
VSRVQHQVGTVDLERADRAHVQVGKVSGDFPIDPTLHFTVILPRRVGVHHHLDAIPSVSLRGKLRHWFEVRILRWIGQPFALVPDVVAERQDCTIRMPVVTKLRPLARPVNIKLRLAGRGSGGVKRGVLKQEQEKAGSVRWRHDPSRLRIFCRQADSVVVRSRDAVTSVEFLIHPHEHRVLWLAQNLPERAGHFVRADGQRELDGFAARVHVGGPRRYPHIRNPRTVPPPSFRLVGRSV